jgi:Bacterial Ig-like domain (group 2)
MKNPIALLVLSLILASCGGGSTGAPSVSVSGPSSNFLKIGEVTNFTASFKDAAGAAVSKTFTWTSSAPNIAEVDSSSGKVTTKRLGKVTISANADGVNSSSAEQTTYGLEVVGGTYDFGVIGLPVSLNTLIRFRSASADAIAPGTDVTVVITGPSTWNAGKSFSSGPWKFGTGGFSGWSPTVIQSAVVSGTYQASTTINGVTYTSSFTVDAMQLQARVTNIAQTGTATANSVSASWTAATGAAHYRFNVGDTNGFKNDTFTTSTTATASGLTLNTAIQNSIYIGAMNFKFDAGLNVVAPAQFNMSYAAKAITF